MILSNLRELYKSLKENNETYYIFEYRKNNSCFQVLFDTFNSPFELHFLLKESNFSFKIIVQKGFHINEFLDRATYKNLCDVLMLKFDEKNPFSTKIFFEEFNSKIPQYKQQLKEERELLKFYVSQIEESDKLYFDGFIEWNKINNGRGATIRNLEKTRILYPNLYEKCKRENISVRYTHIDKNNQTD